MADPDLLDETEEDLDLIRDVGTPIEQSGLGPVPSDLDEIAPDVAPDLAAAPEEAPVAPDVTTGLPPVQGTPAAAANAAEAEALAKRQGEEDIERRRIEAETARRSAEAAREADEDARLSQADYLQRRQAAEQDLDAKTKAYETTKLVDPRTKNKGKAVLSVIFGGLGAAFRSAGGGDSSNHALTNLQKQWHDDTELQKANIAALKDSAVQARTRLGDVEEGRNRMRRDADARLASKYNLALRQGEQQLKDRGVSQAEIDADARILKLREGQAAARAKALQAEDQHALQQARIEQMKRKGGTPGDLQTAQIRVMNARAAVLERKGKGGGGGGGARGGGVGGADVAQHLIDNPGDIPGAKRLAASKGVGSKEFDKIVAQTKGTESQNKSAEQGRAGIRAVESLEKSKYVPTEADTARWLQNQAEVFAAATPQGGGALGIINAKVAGGMRSVGLAAKSEVEGLSPEGQKYFADVRRLMEPLGRAKSGAAISASEWTNFFNQYGPQSSGGYAAARQELQDLLKLSGVAGRSLGATGGTPAKAKSTAPSKEQDSEAVNWAKKNLGDPRARAILKVNGAL